MIAPAHPPPGDIPLATCLSLISSNVRFVPSGTIQPKGYVGLPVMFRLLPEILKLV